MIIVEDDLEISPDFYEYFTATLPLLRTDPSLWCVSAWNDNGKAGLINQTAPELLYRYKKHKSWDYLSLKVSLSLFLGPFEKSIALFLEFNSIIVRLYVITLFLPQV